ncbi:hypothetical protein VP01_4797g1 [Puccinia sorghi]|uniref:Uncharacterized protein n=1 Tax=Puccinia sorghi TaxID=27349 RepID=A0A0L6UND6_9BASI|nr:hypothetical protein VP01_4797g1 [Puccinia sorghi]
MCWGSSGRPGVTDHFEGTYNQNIFPESQNRLMFGTLYQKGWGLSDGESLERFWSSLSPLVTLAHRCKYRNRRSISNLGQEEPAILILSLCYQLTVGFIHSILAAQEI